MGERQGRAGIQGHYGRQNTLSLPAIPSHVFQRTVCVWNGKEYTGRGRKVAQGETTSPSSVAKGVIAVGMWFSSIFPCTIMINFTDTLFPVPRILLLEAALVGEAAVVGEEEARRWRRLTEWEARMDTPLSDN